MAYAEPYHIAQAYADRKTVEANGERQYRLVRARADLYGPDMFQVSVYVREADGGYSFAHQDYIEDYCEECGSRPCVFQKD